MHTEDRPTVHFEPLDPELANSYHEVSAAARERCPVLWSTGHWAENSTGFWLVTGYPEVHDIALDHRRFSSQQGATPVQYDLDMIRLIPLENDEPLHKELRLLLNPFFTLPAIAAVEDRVAAIVEELVTACVAQGTCDVIDSFARVLPPRAFFELFLDLDTASLARVFELVGTMQTQPERELEVVPEILGWCHGLLVEARAQGRRDDLIGTIAHAGFDPEGTIHLTDAERMQMMYLMIVAGIDTTQSALGGIFYELARNSDLRHQIAGLDDTALAHAIEELLRFTSPVTLAGRTVAADTEVGGCPMSKGDRINLNWTAANRDPRMFADPDMIDLTRSNAKKHVAFGSGIHTCLGNHLARRELRLAVRAVAQLTTFELAADVAPPFRSGFTRGPLELQVTMAR
jgi:cytochrome P450